MGYGRFTSAAYGDLSPNSNNALPLTSCRVIVTLGKKEVLILKFILVIHFQNPWKRIF